MTSTDAPSLAGKSARILSPGWRDRFPETWLTLLRWCVCLTLLARGWLTWHWDSPIRGLVWQEDWWAPLLESRFSLSWREFAEQSDPYINSGLTAIGLILIALAFVPWLCSRPKFRWTRWLLWPAALLFFFDSFARWCAKDYDIGMAIEHSLQMISPLALFLTVSFPRKVRLWSLAVSLAAALTFVGHGLYAIGFHPVPLSYQLMTMKILGISQGAAMGFLLVVGWLDIVAAAALFVAPLRRFAIYYLIFWGFLTALARVVSHVGPAQAHFGLDPWLAETLVRTAHWLLPLLLLGMWKAKSD